MTTLPDGWGALALGDIADIVRGVTYKKSDARSAPSPDYTPLLRATNIGSSIDLVGELVYVPTGGVNTKQFLRRGDIVLASSSGSLSVVGKSARLLVDWSGTFGAFCAVIRARSEVDSRYLALYLSSYAVRRRWSEAARGTNINNLKKSDLAPTPVPLPPFDEQRRIGDILEDHLSRLDAAAALSMSAIGRLDILEASGLWHATHGLPGSAAGTVSDVAEVRLGRQRSPKNHAGDRMRPYLRAANVGWDQLRLDDVKQMQFTEAESETYELRDGDILLTEASGSASEVGKSAIFRGEVIEVCFQNTVLRVRCHDGVNPDFVQLYLLAEARFGRFVAGSRGVGIHHLGRAALASWPIMLPPGEVQVAAVRHARELGEATTRAREASQHATDRVEALRRTLLSAAFSGRLTGRTSDVEMVEEMAGV